jgi:transposase InsO family protein
VGIGHRLTKPGTAQTSGMVERFNGCISDILQTHQFLSGEDWLEILRHDVFLYNH